MLERGRRPDFHHEALGAKHGGQLRLEHLDGDLALVPQVVSEIDGCHAPLPELALDAVVSNEGSGKARRGNGHGQTMKRAEPYR